MSDTENRRLCDLRVVDLRAELEKRGLDKTGVKQVLVERLQKALKDEGLDPDTYQFESNDKKPTKRLSVSKEVEADTDSVHAEKMTEEQDTSVDNAAKNGGDSTDKQEEKNSTDAKSTESENTNAVRSSETEEKVDAQDNEKADQKLKEDAESPIRLTLEEEDNLLVEEADQDTEKQVEEPSHSKDGKSSDNKSADAEVTSTTTTAAAGNAADTMPQEDKKAAKGTGQPSSNARAAAKVKRQAQIRNLWITNIAKTTRATELKQALSQYGKVIGAKVVTNARFPGSCCYGYVTMDTVADADRVIEKLSNTELNGQIIKIEKVRPDHMNPLKLASRNMSTESKENKDTNEKPKPPETSKPTEKKKEEKSDSSKDAEKSEKKDDKPTEKKSEKSGEKSDIKKSDVKKPENDGKREKRSRSRDKNRDRARSKTSSTRHRNERSLSAKSKKERRERDVLTFDKIKEERERQRLREQERLLRDQARRRREEAERQKEIERRQRSEAQRLEIEREKLRIEREKIEREKAELIRLERERQKVEREKLELERLEIQRAKMRLQEEDRRAAKRPAPYRREDSYDDRKRSVSDRHYAEAPPPPRFDAPPSVKSLDSDKKYSKDYKSRMSYDKHESYSSKRDRDYPSDRSSLSTRPPPTAITKYDNSNIFGIGRDRDMRTETRGRENTSAVASSSRLPKDSRYSERDRDRSPHYRPVRDDRDRRPVPDHSKADVRSRDHRYSENSKDTGRFERSSNNTWSTTSVKMFNTNSGANSPSKPWVKDSWRPNTEASSSTDRWSTANPSRNSGIGSGGGFTTNSNINMIPTCPPPPGLNNYPSERYDYKSLGSNMRKY